MTITYSDGICHEDIESTLRIIKNSAANLDMKTFTICKRYSGMVKAIAYCSAQK
jgi:hypothetical protein